MRKSFNHDVSIAEQILRNKTNSHRGHKHQHRPGPGSKTVQKRAGRKDQKLLVKEAKRRKAVSAYWKGELDIHP